MEKNTTSSSGVQQPEGSQQQTPPPQQSSQSSGVENEKLWAVIGYLGVLCVLPLLLKKESQFVQFHAKQGLVLFIGELFVWIPLFGWILGLAIFVLWIMAIIAVLQGEMKKLPIVSEIAEKIKL